MSATVQLPQGISWLQRPFPDSNFLLLNGDEPALVDSGFVAHAEATAALAQEYSERLSWVVNTHWHSDHVGANALLQRSGVGIIGTPSDADDLARHSPGCCLAEYLDQPVPRYTIDRPAAHGDRLLLGNSEWEVLAVPGHTPGHLALWNPEDRVLAVGDTLSSYDVGWVNVMLDGTSGVDDALSSLISLREKDARVILPGHGPIIDRPEAAIDKAVERMRRQRGDLDLAVGYGARRVLAFALMIHDGIPAGELDDYLHRRQWVHAAATTLGTTTEDFTRGLVDAMTAGGAITIRDGVARAASEAIDPDPQVFDLPFPRDWS